MARGQSSVEIVCGGSCIAWETFSCGAFARYCSRTSRVLLNIPVAGTFSLKDWAFVSHKKLSGGINTLCVGLGNKMRGSEGWEQCTSPVENRSERGDVGIRKLVALLVSFSLLMLVQTAEHKAVAVLSFAMYDNGDAVAAWLLMRSATNSKSWISSGGAIDISWMMFLYKSANATRG